MKLFELQAREFGRNAKALRQRHGWSMCECARTGKLSKGIWSKVEAGKNLNPSLHTMMVIAWTLNTTVGRLLKEPGRAK